MDSDLLRLLTCGSVDDGKSTLIGRLLHEGLGLYEDQLAALERDSKKSGSAGDAIDFSLLLDGLKAERQQGITIDVAYRYFSTPRRKFIIADCPGHVQYTRNMITGGSTANLAILLVDARNGVLEQTRRHSFLVSLLDIGHVIVCVNKMDLIDYSEARFEEIRADFTRFAARLDLRNIDFIPVSALLGDNVASRSDSTPWYRGAPLLDKLERVHIASDRNLIDLRFPVQYVVRRDQTFRGYSGTVASGVLRKGAEVAVLPSGRKTTIASITTYDGELESATPPQAVTITVADDLDISRGDTVVAPQNTPRMESELEAMLVWMDETALDAERAYLIKHLHTEARAEVAAIRYRIDINNLGRVDTERLELNEIGRVKLRLSQAIAHDPYARNRALGSFILIDPASNQTAGAGMILDRPVIDGADPRPGADALRRESRRHQSSVAANERRARRGHGVATVWLTGLPGSGKTTTAYALEQHLFERGVVVRVLDAESLRLGVSSDLGFGSLERSESVRRAAHIAKLFNEIGAIVIVALVSPYAADRAEARSIIGVDQMIEVHVSTALDVCEARDDSETYARARAGQIARFTGVSAPYEPPDAAELNLDLESLSVDDAVARLAELLEQRGILSLSAS